MSGLSVNVVTTGTGATETAGGTATAGTWPPRKPMALSEMASALTQVQALPLLLALKTRSRSRSWNFRLGLWA